MRFAILLLLIAAISPCSALSRAPKQMEIRKDPIGVMTYSFFDEARKRPVVVEFWYPTVATQPLLATEEGEWVQPKELREAPVVSNGKKLPLVIMSHGYGGHRRGQSWLADILVQHGYAVAAVDHEGNTGTTLNALATLQFWNRPQDVSFALDRLFREPLLQGCLDPERVGFVGYSLGGVTGLALAGAVVDKIESAIEKYKNMVKGYSSDALTQIDMSPAKRSYYDPRIKAILLLAPFTWGYNRADALKSLKTPIALVASMNDDVLSFEEHWQPLIMHSIPSRLKILRNGATHSIFHNLVSEKGKKMLKERYYLDPPGVDRKIVHEEVGAFALDFFGLYLNSSSKIANK